MFRIRFLGAAIAALLAAPLAHAATDTGFYVGLGGGKADYSDGLGNQIRNAYVGNPNYAVTSASLNDSSGNAWKAEVGYRFLPWLSAELAYTDAGEAGSQFSLHSIAPLTNGTANLNGRYELKGTSLALVAEWPIADAFALSFRAGIVDSSLKYHESGTDATNAAYSFRGPSDSSTGSLAGIGLGWRLGPQWDLRLDWDRWFDVGTRFDLDRDTNGRFNNVDIYTVNLQYRFQH